MSLNLSLTTKTAGRGLAFEIGTVCLQQMDRDLSIYSRSQGKPQ